MAVLWLKVHPQKTFLKGAYTLTPKDCLQPDPNSV
jgi:hypothetical protein